MLRSVRATILVLATGFATTAAADFDYLDFTSTAGLQLVEDAQVLGTYVAVTPSLISQKGAVWTTDQQSVGGGFSTQFQIEFADPFGGADGMAFVIQNESNQALGNHASALGYGGFAGSPGDGITNSLAVEFDNYLNGTTSDPNGNHISVHTLGSAPNSALESASIGITSNIPSLTGTHEILIEYQPGSMTIYMDDLVTPVLTVQVDLSTILGGGDAWIGFTASTGGEWEEHRVHNWSFVSASQQFERGDVSADGAVNLGDVVVILNALFVPGNPQPVCSQAADVNDDGSFSLPDAVVLLNHLFVPNSIPIPSPFGACGNASAGNPLPCDQFDACP